MHNRRDILTHLGLGAAGCALLSQSSTAKGALHQVKPDAPSPWWLVSPLSVGGHLGSGWHVQALGPIREGAAVMRIAHPQHASLSIHICRHGGAPRGYASTEVFDLIVMDGGAGQRQVTPDLQAVFHRIADQIRINEMRADRSAQLDDIENMMTHSERVRTFGPPHLQETR